MGLGGPLRATSCLADNSWPILEAATDALRESGLDIDIRRDLDPASADLVFACGLLTRVIIDAGAPLDVIAAPVFAGETGPTYRSVVVTRADDDLDLEAATRGRFGVNDYGSWSGWFGYLTHLAEHGFDPPPQGRRHETGGHVQSLEAITTGACDVAAIDSSVWDHHRHDTPGLRVVDTTRTWPAPPFSVSPALDADARRILTSVTGIVPTDITAYDEMFETAKRFS